MAGPGVEVTPSADAHIAHGVGKTQRPTLNQPGRALGMCSSFSFP